MGDQAPKLPNARYCARSKHKLRRVCKMGFDARLKALASAFQRVDCDVDYDDDFAKWHKGALESSKRS